MGATLWDAVATAPPMAVVLTVVAALLGAQLALWGWSARRRQRQAELRRRLRLDLEGEGPRETSLLREARYARDPRADRLLRRLPGTASLHALIEGADAELTVAAVMRRMGALAALGVLGSYAFHRDLGLQVAAGLALGGLPPLLLARQGAARVQRLWRQLPDALDLMTRSLRAGHGIGAALQLVATEMPLPIATEFARTFERYRLGEELGDALARMAARNRACRDLGFFAIAVSLQRETGGNLVEILENLARTIRARFTLQAKIRALTAEARLSSWIVGAMPFVTLAALAVLRREYIATALRAPLGRGMLIAGFAWFAVGLLVMRRVLKVEV